VSAVEWWFVLAAMLFCIGAYGVLARRNLIVVVMCLELMLNAVNIALVAASNFIPAAAGKGSLFVLFVITVAAAEVTVGLAIIIANYRNKRTAQADEYHEMKG
jgi:NADH:ubiquinone oxidoreductase subunit K